MYRSRIFQITFLVLVSLGMVAIFGLSACGGGETDTESDQTAATENVNESDTTVQTAETEARVIEIEGTDKLKFTVTEITAKPGEKITVKLINKSSLPPNVMSHNFVLLKKGVDPVKFNNDVLA